MCPASQAVNPADRGISDDVDPRTVLALVAENKPKLEVFPESAGTAAAAAIDLVKLKELSLAEASAHSGVSVSALKVSVHRAMKNLKQHFAGSL